MKHIILSPNTILHRSDSSSPSWASLLMNKNALSLPEHIVRQIVDTARRYPQIEKIVLFGSWALGNAKSGSDIDLALSGHEVESKIVTAFQSYLEEETTIPHFFDVVHFETTENKELRRHILENGITIYSAAAPGEEKRAE